MRTAAAFEAGKPVADLLVRGVRGVAQQGGRGHDPAVEAIAALRHLLGDEGRLQRVRLLRCAEAGERRDLGFGRCRDRHRARTGRSAVEMYGAGAALREPAAEMWVAETE